MLMSC